MEAGAEWQPEQGVCLQGVSALEEAQIGGAVF